MSQHLRTLLTWVSRCASGVIGDEELLLLLPDEELAWEACKAGTRREAARTPGMAGRYMCWMWREMRPEMESAWAWLDNEPIFMI